MCVWYSRGDIVKGKVLLVWLNEMVKLMIKVDGGDDDDDLICIALNLSS